MRSKGKSRNHRQYVGSYMTFAGKLLISPGKHSKMRRSARIMKIKPEKILKVESTKIQKVKSAKILKV